jgi:hypothetical protein
VRSNTSRKRIAVEQQSVSHSVDNRHALRTRIDQLIERLRAGEVEAVRDAMYDGRWRAKLNVTAVDSGQLGYADDLLDEGHTILRQTPDNMAAAIEKLENARGKLM